MLTIEEKREYDRQWRRNNVARTRLNREFWIQRNPEKHRAIDFTVNRGVHPWSPSLDCISRSQGYVKGNVRITCYVVNVAINRFTDAELLTMCRAIVKRHEPSGHDNGS